MSSERAKGVFITEEGVIGFNKADNILTSMPLNNSIDSRIELISEDEAIFREFEQTLLDCSV